MSLVLSGWQLNQAVGQRKEEKDPNGLSVPHQKYNPNQGRGRERPLQPDQRWELAADKGCLEDSPGPSDTQGTQSGHCPSPLRVPSLSVRSEVPRNGFVEKWWQWRAELQESEVQPQGEGGHFQANPTISALRKSLNGVYWETFTPVL